MMLAILSYIYLWDGRSIYAINSAPAELIDSLTSSINLTFSTPSFPMIRELRDSLFARNEFTIGFYEGFSANVDVSDAIRSIGKRKLTDMEIIAILNDVARRYGLNSRIYCIVKYDQRTGDVFPFDLTPLYGTFAYGCYPIMAIDGAQIVSPRRFSTITLLSDIVRFPQEIFQMDAPALLYQLKGFRCALIESLERSKEPSPQEFRVLK